MALPDKAGKKRGRMKEAVFAILFFIVSAAGVQAQDTASVKTAPDTQIVVHQNQDTLKTSDSLDFCQSVFNIIESSRNSFIDIKGDVRKEQNNFHGRKIQYNVLTGFPESVCTYIEADITQRFQCIMDTGQQPTPQLHARLQAMSEKLKSCLGENYNYNFIENKAEGTALFQARANGIYDPNITVRLKDEEGVFVLMLEVSEPFFKRK